MKIKTSNTKYVAEMEYKIKIPPKIKKTTIGLAIPINYLHLISLIFHADCVPYRKGKLIHNHLPNNGSSPREIRL